MLALALGLLLLALGRAFPDRFEQILLILLERLLAGGALSLRQAAVDFPAGGYPSSASVRAAVQRNQVKIVRPRERDALFILREMRIRLSVARFS